MQEDSYLVDVFYSTMLKTLKKEDAEVIYDLAKRLVALSKPRKSYMKMYNSSKGREERKQLAKGE